ncbi:MAG: type 1 glutamine amidotransferase [Solirubrobacterales bacterium]
MRVLSIVHQADAGAGVFAESLREAGAEIDDWLISEGGDAPADPFGYDAVMVFGGAMHVDQDDRHAWLDPEKRLLAGLLHGGRPVLGACLGAQLLCAAAGGQVRRMPEPEIGWFDVEVTAGGAEDPLLGPLAPRFSAFQWHSYECVPPPQSPVLARSATCAQAFKLGSRAWALQFHAEVGAADADAWIDDWRSDEDAVRIGLDAEALRAETAAAIPEWNELGRDLAARWLEAIAASAPA